MSDDLIQVCVNMNERNQLKYLPWDQCTTLALEMVGVKRDKNLAATSTDLQVGLAFRRRGLAFDMGDVMGWEAHESLREEMMCAFAREPLSGYAKVSLEQVKKADEMAFYLLSKFAKQGIKRVGTMTSSTGCETTLRRHVGLKRPPLDSVRGWQWARPT